MGGTCFTCKCKKDIITLENQKEFEMSKEMEKKKLEQEKMIFEKVLNNLEEAKINFININSSSCYQSSTLQGFVHLIYPLAIRNLNKERDKKGQTKIKNLDELKNNNQFNDMIIDILKEINNKEEYKKKNPNNNINNLFTQQNYYFDKRFKADKLFDKYPPEQGIRQGLLNEYDCNKLHELLINDALPSDSSSSSSNNNLSNNTKDNPTKILIIKKRTIISDILKIKIEGNIYPHGNLVLNFSEDDLNDNNLSIFKLLKNCPQLKKDSYSHKKITDISNIIYIFIDRVKKDKNEGISKNFIINEKIYFDKTNKNFTQKDTKYNSLYELKFIIYHSSCSLSSGHYIAYQKIKGVWFYFNDLDSGYANKVNPLLNDYDESSQFPVILYYVLDDEREKKN